MKVLAIDTTGPGGGAALLLGDGDEVTTALVPEDVRRGKTLVPLISGLLREAGIRMEDLDLVACGIGPGSFTGIRIGIATAATLAYAAGVPVLGLGSLHGRAANATAHDVFVALNARRGNVFGARFTGGCLIGEYAHGPMPDDLPPGVEVVGDKAPVRPDVLASLAAACPDRQQPHELRPLYLRRSDPEERRAR